ncbi:Hypothetical protein A7982_03221 [Minicystis rosea]|nr:Hypothetical protein A7982_03221 [Minicystis rosea]
MVLLVSALVVLGGAAAARSLPASAPASSAVTTGPGLPPPLPSGAPVRGLEELPTDDERAAGCHFADRGFGDYGGWRKVPMGRALVPVGHGVDENGGFRLLVHFHGAEPVRKQLAPEGLGLVIAAVDAGVGSRAYERVVAEPDSFDKMVSAIEAEVAATNGLPSARARVIVLSSWSAGYGAVTQILARRTPRIGAVVLLDSLYAGYANGGRTVEHGQLPAFVEAARNARAGGAPFYLTHTAIATPGYASTAEVASFLLGELGATATNIEDSGAAERFPLRRMFEEGHLWIRGYAGADRDAHCAQLHQLATVLRDAVLPSLHD